MLSLLSALHPYEMHSYATILEPSPRRRDGAGQPGTRRTRRCGGVCPPLLQPVHYLPARSPSFKFRVHGPRQDTPCSAPTAHESPGRPAGVSWCQLAWPRLMGIERCSTRTYRELRKQEGDECGLRTRFPTSSHTMPRWPPCRTPVAARWPPGGQCAPAAPASQRRRRGRRGRRATLVDQAAQGSPGPHPARPELRPRPLRISPPRGLP